MRRNGPNCSHLFWGQSFPTKVFHLKSTQWQGIRQKKGGLTARFGENDSNA